MPDRVVITAPPARPPRYSLIGVAEALNTLDERVLLDGYKFDPEVCGSNRGGVLEILCGDEQTEPMDAPAQPAIVEGDPFVIFTADECSTFGFAARDWDGRATRMMNAVQSFWLARELATGSLGLEQHSLNDAASTEVTTGAVSIAQALAAVEDGMAAAGRGERGMIHVTNGTLVLMAAESLIRLDGTVWVTATGNVVVADAGYTGSAPGEDTAPVDGSSWIYGTSMIGVRLGALDIVPGSFNDARARAAMIDRSINVVTIYAARPALWVWDECVHVAGQFDPALSVATSEVTINGNVEVSNDAGSALPISAAALPLPAGAATAANQATTNAALTAIAALVDGLEGSVDGLEALIAATNAALATVDGHVDGLEALITATNAALATIDGRVDGLEGSLTTLTTHLQAATRVEADSAGLTTASTNYTSGDQVGTEIALAGMASAAGWGGLIVGVTLLDKALKLNAGDFEVWFFRQSVTPAADNAAAVFSDADMAHFVGRVKVLTADWVANANNAVGEKAGLSIGYTCVATSLFAYLVTRQANAFFTAVGDVRLTVTALRD